jgi:hypothetical protein
MGDRTCTTALTITIPKRRGIVIVIQGGRLIGNIVPQKHFLIPSVFDYEDRALQFS